MSMFAQTTKPIYSSQAFELWPDHVQQGPYSARALSVTAIESNYPQASSSAGWTLQHDLARYPRSTSDYPLLDALYNLSLEELQLDTREDGAFNAGAKWQGVWTRDVSYSILLSLAAVDPEGAKRSLLHKVNRDRIVQDTGTGGSWPVSSDRVTWALAAWEVYLVTGDRAWLEQSYTVIRSSILDDEAVVIDPATGLARGESSFMDWREQTYPRWMEPADIYESKNLGTNAVYFRTYRILSEMAHELGRPAEQWDVKAQRIRSAMNTHLWQKDRGYYGQYLYGRGAQTLSPRSDALGQALAILFDIADPAQQASILSAQPLMPFGIPTVYPETPNISPYHNRSVWPFVQAYWNLAAAKRGDDAALLYGIGALNRAAALFLTNKENFVADTGSPVGTAINSDRQLWSVAGNLAMVYRVFFGMDFRIDGLHIDPVVPQPLAGTRTLTNFHYRQAVLSITVKGFGRQAKLTLDGKPVALIAPNLTGSHDVLVELDGRAESGKPVHLVASVTAPETPTARMEGANLEWSAVEGAARYTVYQDAQVLGTTAATSMALAPVARLTRYQVAAFSADGVSSFLSAPVDAGPEPLVITTGDTTIEQTGMTGIAVSGSVAENGVYAVQFRYANGSGPISTENKCAVRTLFIDGNLAGPIVLPQRGENDWNNWGLSTELTAHISAGEHHFELRLLPENINMNGEVNRARIEAIVLNRVK